MVYSSIAEYTASLYSSNQDKLTFDKYCQSVLDNFYTDEYAIHFKYLLSLDPQPNKFVVPAYMLICFEVVPNVNLNGLTYLDLINQKDYISELPTEDSAVGYLLTYDAFINCINRSAAGRELIQEYKFFLQLSVCHYLQYEDIVDSLCSNSNHEPLELDSDDETSDDEGDHCYTCTNHRHRLIEHRLSQIEFYTVGAWLVVPKLKEQIETLELIINVSAYMLLMVVLIHYLKLTPVA